MKEQYKVGIISDTHGLLREEVINYLKTCDYIIHGGDINTEDVLKKLDELNIKYELIDHPPFILLKKRKI